MKIPWPKSQSSPDDEEEEEEENDLHQHKTQPLRGW